MVICRFIYFVELLISTDDFTVTQDAKRHYLNDVPCFKTSSSRHISK